MINRRNILFALIFLTAMILSACAQQPGAANPPSAGQTPPDDTTGGQAPSGGMVTKDKAPFAVAAKTALAQKLGIAVDQVSFVSADPVEWSDSCLGLGGPAESCAQVITPGYKVILSAQGTNYEVHTDEQGTIVRIKE